MPASREDLRTARVASLTLVNAMIFQQMLAQLDRRVTPVERALTTPNVAESFDQAWTVILEEIDYVPIFTLARDILRDLMGNAGIDDGLRTLARTAIRITSRRAALRHDLMGRIYHRLLADAKFYGAFYTTIPAATLLLRLTLHPRHWQTDFASVEDISALRIADLACGTGTLLKAALQTVGDNHVRARAELGDEPALGDVYRALVEHGLWGFDVIPFAIHLAGSALALHEPNVTFGDMNLRTMPLGLHPQPHLGSLDFLFGSQAEVQADLFGGPVGPQQVTGAGTRSRRVTIPPLDLCVMNPPFVRSVGGNLLFGNLPKNERARLQEHLRNTVARRNIQANITAGLAPVFAAMAHQFIKPGGHIALVVPRALVNGVAWQPTRELLGKNYHVRYVIVSHEPGGWNFSENTKLSEALVVAKRRGRGDEPGPTKFVNLWSKPATSIEALTLADLVEGATGVPLEASAGIEVIQSGNRKYAEVIEATSERVASGAWAAEVAFAQTDLCRVAHHLSQGRVYLPAIGLVAEFPTIRLGDVVTLGPDVRDIHDGFKFSRTTTPYSAFSGHETDRVQQMLQHPNAYLSPLPKAKRGRPLRDAQLLWSRSGRVLIAERLRLNNARVTSVRLPKPVLSNSWWPAAASGKHAVQIEKALCLWLNSTLGIMSFIAARVDTEGAWVKFKKPVLAEIHVLDPQALDPGALAAIASAFDHLATVPVASLPDIASDDARARIDLALAEIMGWRDDLAVVRQLLAAEPIFRTR